MSQLRVWGTAAPGVGYGQLMTTAQQGQKFASGALKRLELASSVNIIDQTWRDNELVLQWAERWSTAQRGRNFKSEAPQRLRFDMASW
ncbi:unnamed protein product [Schistocephalus solidus]|uniref:N-acetyltransferase domain-containing protein n=1 Tax=Schistocephalus solidus TaxID=70667 RepID=A0A183SV12_SCHSO|nr:unnamed protein product [Schistocephalus solidus]